MKTCPKCGAENPEESEFCSNCGSSFAQAAPPPAGPPPAGPPPAGVQPPAAPYAQQPYAPPPGGGYGPQTAYPATNSKATASLVLGIIGLFVCPIVCSVIAIILGYSAKNEIAASGGRETGESNANAGIILGWVGIVLYVIGIIIAIIIAIIAAANAALFLPLTLLPLAA